MPQTFYDQTRHRATAGAYSMTKASAAPPPPSLSQCGPQPHIQIHFIWRISFQMMWSSGTTNCGLCGSQPHTQPPKFVTVASIRQPHAAVTPDDSGGGSLYRALYTMTEVRSQNTHALLFIIRHSILPQSFRMMTPKLYTGANCSASVLMHNQLQCDRCITIRSGLCIAIDLIVDY